MLQAANVESGLLSNQKVERPTDFENFIDISAGIPILIPAESTVFEFSKSDIFEIDYNEILKVVYGIEFLDYVGFRHAFASNKFIKDYKIKKNYSAKFRHFVSQNLESFHAIEKLQSKFNKIGAFQTRNIPHLGHELIINKMLEFCDHVVINPVLGPKKEGDVNLASLKDIYSHLIKNRYKDKISFMPIYANMFYAGPREAIHHAIMRKTLGFAFFSVGRDHAGAEGVYLPNAASKAIDKYQSMLGIEVMQHNGAKYCSRCAKVVLDGDCKHDVGYLSDISGSEFRDCLKKKHFYPLADKSLQEYVFDSNLDLFEK